MTTATMEVFIDSKEDDSNIKYKLRQGLLTAVCLLQSMCSGCVQGYSSVLLSQLESTKEIPLKTDEQSWLASIPTLIMLPMVLSSGWILGVAGRRFTLGLVIITTLIAFGITGFATSYASLFAGRLVGGIFLGQAYPVMVTYLGEATHPKSRATCLASVPLGAALGVLITQLLGMYLHWRVVALIMAVIPVINIIVYRYLSESYIWLLNKNRVDEARDAFIWFRGTSLDAQSEFLAALDSKNTANNCSLLEKLKFCKNRAFIMPFFLTGIAYLTSEFSGDTALIFYTSHILKTITDDPDTQFVTNLALNILRVVATLIAALLIKKYSVRRTFIVTGYATALSLAAITIFLFLSAAYPDNEVFPTICLVSVTVNVAFFALGLGPLPTVICGEMYPAFVRDIGGAFSAFLAFSCLFTIVKLMPHFYEIMAPGFIFLIFACCTIVGVTIVSFTLPNTQHKTLKEIEVMYGKK